ncbi:hypothetical protein NL676_021306 [Syzygium grande]|nr:hypothetical protein NL676_021306 [Syzygium grande]
MVDSMTAYLREEGCRQQMLAAEVPRGIMSRKAVVSTAGTYVGVSFVPTETRPRGRRAARARIPSAIRRLDRLTTTVACSSAKAQSLIKCRCA